MTIRNSVLWVALVGGQIAGAHAQQRNLRLSAYRCQLPKADCALFPEASELPHDKDGVIPHTGRFTPTCEQAAKVEQALLTVRLENIAERQQEYYPRYPVLIKKNLARYHRQYFGFYNVRNQPCLYLSFFWENVQENLGFIPRWRREVIQVEDGGAGFWSVYYNLSTRKFYKFRHNEEG